MRSRAGEAVMRSDGRSDRGRDQGRGRRWYLKSARSAASALGLTAGQGSCLIGQTSFSPAVPDWIRQLAIGVDAEESRRSRSSRAACGGSGPPGRRRLSWFICRGPQTAIPGLMFSSLSSVRDASTSSSSRGRHYRQRHTGRRPHIAPDESRSAFLRPIQTRARFLYAGRGTYHGECL
jgi:hypothetical protein